MTSVYEYSNKTQYGIQNSAVRYAWAGYYIFVILSGLLGGTTILIASVKYKAINLHKSVVSIIQHIAVCDLLTCLSFYLFKTISLIADDWIFGKWMCYLQFYFRHYVTAVGAYLICAMTTTKLLILFYPLRAGSLTSKCAHIGCAVVWVCTISVPAIFIIENSDISFDYRIFDCMYNFHSSKWQWCKPVLVMLFLIIPAITVVATTSCLVYMAYRIAKRDHETLKWQGLTATILTATVYCISVLPSILIAIASRSVSLSSSSELHFYRVAVTCLTLNTISNIYIYCLTVTSFRQFLWSRILFMYSSRTSISLRPNQGPR